MCHSYFFFEDLKKVESKNIKKSKNNNESKNNENHTITNIMNSLNKLSWVIFFFAIF